jgi:hypothetical protein
MSAQYKKKTAKDLLFATARHHLKTMEAEIEGCQIIAEPRRWNYNHFIGNVLEVMVILRHRNERKNTLQE